MAPIHTLNSGSTVAENFQGCGYKLDSTRERELESERNELLIKTEFFANKCSDFRNAKVLAETRSDELAKELKSKNEKILHHRIGNYNHFCVMRFWHWSRIFNQEYTKVSKKVIYENFQKVVYKGYKKNELLRIIK
ncbi:11120_t:CDS:2 [Entrophospora sp. SA101]|nr:11120_t:CDS:2 [Entrophospora sp. SA101]